MDQQIINFKEHKQEINEAIRNIENLPGGLKCNFLVAIRGHNSTLIAKAWKRRLPKLDDNEVVIIFQTIYL